MVTARQTVWGIPDATWWFAKRAKRCKRGAAGVWVPSHSWLWHCLHSAEGQTCCVQHRGLSLPWLMEKSFWTWPLPLAHRLVLRFMKTVLASGRAYLNLGSFKSWRNAFVYLHLNKHLAFRQLSSADCQFGAAISNAKRYCQFIRLRKPLAAILPMIWDAEQQAVAATPPCTLRFWHSCWVGCLSDFLSLLRPLWIFRRVHLCLSTTFETVRIMLEETWLYQSSIYIMLTELVKTNPSERVLDVYTSITLILVHP